MDSGLADKVVLVTGASGGIGRALVDAFAEEGASLALVGNTRADELERRVRERGLSERALVLAADVADPDAIDGAMQRARERFGRVDACVANAGVWPAPHRHAGELEPERVRATIGVNLLGALWTARAFLRALAASGPRADGDGAALVFTGSTAGRFGEAGHADYAASKAGLTGLVLSLKNELARIDPFGRVNLVEPGWTVTEMARAALEDDGLVRRVVRTMALRQLGRAADVARAVVWLCSPRLARHVSGQTITVAGGMEGRLLWDEGEVDPAAVRARARS